MKHEFEGVQIGNEVLGMYVGKYLKDGTPVVRKLSSEQNARLHDAFRQTIQDLPAPVIEERVGQALGSERKFWVPTVFGNVVWSNIHQRMTENQEKNPMDELMHGNLIKEASSGINPLTRLVSYILLSADESNYETSRKVFTEKKPDFPGTSNRSDWVTINGRYPVGECPAVGFTRSIVATAMPVLRPLHEKYGRPLTP